MPMCLVADINTSNQLSARYRPHTSTADIMRLLRCKGVDTYGTQRMDSEKTKQILIENRYILTLRFAAGT